MYTELFVFAFADTFRENAHDRASSYGRAKRASHQRKLTSAPGSTMPRWRLRTLRLRPAGGPA